MKPSQPDWSDKTFFLMCLNKTISEVLLSNMPFLSVFKTTVIVTGNFLYNKAMVEIKQHPAVLVLIVIAGLALSSDASGSGRDRLGR